MLACIGLVSIRVAPMAEELVDACAVSMLTHTGLVRAGMASELARTGLVSCCLASGLMWGT